MSAASKDSGNWFGQNYDKLTLVVALVLLLASSVYLLLIINGEKREIEDADFITRGVVKNPAEPVDIEAYVEDLKNSTRPFDSSNVTSNRLLTSEERVSCVNPECLKPIPYNATACPWCQKAQPEVKDITTLDRDEDGIPDVDEKALGLDPFDPNDALMDPDGDAFTNVEEFRFGSDPDDEDSTPPMVTKLRIANAIPKPIGLVFKSIRETGEVPSFQINSLTERNRSYFKSVGEEILGFVIESYDAEANSLFLRKGDRELTLELNKVGRDSEWEVRLVSLLDGKTYPAGRTDTLKPGSEFEVDGSTYKVIDITATAALIQDTNSGEEISVARYTPAELQDFRYRMQQRRTESRR